MFLDSQSPPERQHLVDACRFELAKVERLAIRERVVALFAEIDPDFAAEVAAAVGVTPGKPARQPPVARQTSTPAPSPRKKPPVPASPALSLMNQPRSSIRTRKIALLAAPGVRGQELDVVKGALLAEGAAVEIVSAVLGPLHTDDGRACDATKTFFTTDSVLYDAVLLLGGAESVWTLRSIEQTRTFVRDAFQHGKPIGALNEGVEVLAAAELADIELANSAEQDQVSDRGVVTAFGQEASDPELFADAFIAAIRQHRHFDRPQAALRPSQPVERQPHEQDQDSPVPR
jgi:catalase